MRFKSIVDGRSNVGLQSAQIFHRLRSQGRSQSAFWPDYSQNLGRFKVCSKRGCRKTLLETVFDTSSTLAPFSKSFENSVLSPPVSRFTRRSQCSWSATSEFGTSLLISRLNSNLLRPGLFLQAQRGG